MSSFRVSAPLRQLLSAASRPRACVLSTSTSTPCRRHQPGQGVRGQRLFSAAASTPGNGSIKDLLQVSDEVSDAIAHNKPVVALESTIYTHGAMGNELAQEHVDLVRSCGGIPAIIGIYDGLPKVGVSPEEIVRMIESQGTAKASRRDISYLVGMGIAGRKMHGGTTISGTMLLARLAGIRVFGTGGLGGVHRGGEDSMDISADLTELGRTRVAVIASGCKGFLDIPRTLEFLETQGCHVSTFADGRTGRIDFPGFWARQSGTKSPSVVNTEKEAAAIILAQEKLGIESGMLFANPIPEDVAIPLPEIQEAIETAVSEAAAKGFTGAANTPYVLGRLKELTGNKAVTANMALVRANIVRSTRISVELSKLLSSDARSDARPNPVLAPRQAEEPVTSSNLPTNTQTDVLVAGSVALDLSCDYTGAGSGDASPQVNTSNPASISQSIGGVGHNVALAAHTVSQHARVKFCSMVGDDVAGSTVLSALEASGLDTSSFRKLGTDCSPAGRTAQYVAVNDGQKNLVMAMADMGIFEQHSFPEYWRLAVEATKPKWLVVDGNWSEGDVRSWVEAGTSNGAKVAFEPVSVEKSRRLFSAQPSDQQTLRLFPQPSVDLATPNIYELSAMYEVAKANGYMDSPAWFEVIDSFGMRGAREKFVYLTSRELTDAGVPVQSVQLLPYIPTLITKLGPKGVLLTMMLHRDDPRLREPESQPFILARATNNHPTVGGIYMRLFPPVEEVKDIVSVNGAGDTFMGVLMSGLAQGGRVDRLVDVAQRGAVLSLRCAESVSKRLGSLEQDLRKAAKAS